LYTTYEGLDHLLLIKARLLYELSSNLLSDGVVHLATRVGEKVLRIQGRECFDSVFEFLACFVMALKLTHGLIDTEESGDITSKLRHSFNIESKENTEPPAWRIRDLARITDLKAQIKFVDSNIWPSKDQSSHDQQSVPTAAKDNYATKVKE